MSAAGTWVLALICLVPVLSGVCQPLPLSELSSSPCYCVLSDVFVFLPDLMDGQYYPTPAVCVSLHPQHTVCGVQDVLLTSRSPGSLSSACMVYGGPQVWFGSE